MIRKIVSGLIVACMGITLAACAYQSKQQKGTAVGAGMGAATGAVIGQAIGKDTESTLWGAAIGAVVGGIAGNQTGAYMDRQEQELRAALAASEAASIRREQDILTATFKGDVFFEFDSAALLPGAFVETERVAGVLNKYSETVIRVEGHTDATGPDDYNQRLSEKRAQSVADALIRQGVDPSRTRTVGFGETELISSEDAMNRRVNIVIVPVRQG